MPRTRRKTNDHVGYRVSAAPSFSLGVEEEYLIVDRATRRLATSPPPSFMAACEARLGERVSHEYFQAQVEIATPVCPDVATLEHELRSARHAVQEAAAEHGFAMVAASTHPFAYWRDLPHVDRERYNQLTSDFGIVIRRFAICGMHVHVGLDDPELRIDLMSQASYFLPHLLALSTSSPFWEGEDTDLMAYRPTVFADLPRTGIPDYLENDRDWHALLEALDQTGLCSDPTMIWWDLRPSVRFPTLELRVCDVCTRVGDAVTIAALFQALLATLYELRNHNQRWRRYPNIMIEENKWRAQRDGIHGQLADFGRRQAVAFPDLLEEMLELFQPAAEKLAGWTAIQRARDIVARGTSSDQQRARFKAVLDQGGERQDALNAVVDWLIETSAADCAVNKVD